MRTPFACFILAANMALGVMCRADNIVIADFDLPDYGGWQQTGDAFRTGPVSGDIFDQPGIAGVRHKRVCISKASDEVARGMLTSLPFVIERPHIAFYIRGGNYEHSTCLNLLIDGRVIRSAVGWNSDRLLPASWSVGEDVRQPRRNLGLPIFRADSERIIREGEQRSVVIHPLLVTPLNSIWQGTDAKPAVAAMSPSQAPNYERE